MEEEDGRDCRPQFSRILYDLLRHARRRKIRYVAQSEKIPLHALNTNSKDCSISNLEKLYPTQRTVKLCPTQRTVMIKIHPKVATMITDPSSQLMRCIHLRMKISSRELCWRRRIKTTRRTKARKMAARSVPNLCTMAWNVAPLRTNFNSV